MHGEGDDADMVRRNKDDDLESLAEERAAFLERAEKAEGELVRFEKSLRIDRRVALFATVIDDALKEESDKSLQDYLDDLHEALWKADKAIEKKVPFDTMGLVSMAGRMAAAAMVVVNERIEARMKGLKDRVTGGG